MLCCLSFRTCNREMDKKGKKKTNGPIQMGDLWDTKWAPNLYQVSVEIYYHASVKHMRIVLGDSMTFRSIGCHLDC